MMNNINTVLHSNNSDDYLVVADNTISRTDVAIDINWMVETLLVMFPDDVHKLNDGLIEKLSPLLKKELALRNLKKIDE